MSFKDFHFHQAILSGIQSCGYTTPTPIQQKSIPHMLAGRDMLGLAQTGTGKTAAFVLPMLQRLLGGPRKTIRALVMAPTRELAQQIHDNIQAMARDTNLRSTVVYGGVGRQPQLKALRMGTEIIVACPGRLLDLLGEKGINLSSIELLVLDEADHMFDKGFLPDMRRIIQKIPAQRQSVIFSATMPNEIARLTREVLVDPVQIKINHAKAKTSIEHSLFSVSKAGKKQLLKTLLQEEEMHRTLVFTRTKYSAKNLAHSLQRMGFQAASMQGNLSQQKRQVALEGFRQGKFTILVATDIAARGIDVDEISHVINYDIPDTIEAYVHRTGRTGRAQHTGKAFTFVSQEDTRFIEAVTRKFSAKMSSAEKRIQPSIRENNTVDNRKHFSSMKKTTRPTSRKSGYKKKRGLTSFDFGLQSPAAN